MGAVPEAKIEQKELEPVPLEPTPDIVRLLERKRGGRPLPTGADDLLSTARRKLTSVRELRLAVPPLSPGARLLAQQQQQLQQKQLQSQYRRTSRQ